MKPLMIIKKLFTIEKGYTQEIRKVREDILKGVLIVCAVVGLPAILISAVDAYKQSQWPFIVIYIGLYLILPISLILYRRISYYVRAMIPLLVSYLLSLSILIRIGLSGVGSELLIACCVLATMLFGLRFGIAVMASGAATFAAIGAMMITGVLPVNAAAMLNSTSPAAWITTVLTFIIITSILAISPILFQKKLQESIDQYRHLVNYAPAGICELDLSTGKFTFVNDVICQYAGYTAEEMLNKKPMELLDGDGATLHLERMGQVSQGNAPISSVEYHVISKDGKEWDVTVNPSYTYSDGKVTKALYVIHDISDRKKWERELLSSLKEKEILLKEIHHRVKNNMQVISSLLSLQSAYIHDDRDRKMFTNMQNRVRSMASVHEKLYQSENLTSVDMGDFVKSLISQVTASSVATTDSAIMLVDTEDVYLTIEKAVPCTLIINELVTNAYEHAFPGGRRGTITVSLKKGPDDVITLIVEDNGVGFPDDFNPYETDSLGIKLVKALVQQLQGTITFEKAAGNRCVITF